MSSVASATKRRPSMRSPQGKAPREQSSASSTPSKAKRSRRSSTATTGGTVDLGQLLALGGGREGEEEEWENGDDDNMTANTADINLLLDGFGGIDRQQYEAPRDRRTLGGGRRSSITKAIELNEENNPAAINDENAINAGLQSASPAVAVVNNEVTMRSTPAGLQQQATIVMNTNDGSAIRRRSSSMNSTTSNSGRKSSLSRAPLREASPAALSSQQQQQQQPPMMRDRRLTADIVDIQQLQAALNERSNQSTSPASPQGCRRDTADPESLRCLISLLRSPGPPCSSPERVVAPLFLESAASAAATARGGGEANGTTMTTTMELNESRVTADNSQIMQLIEDLEISLTDGMGDDGDEGEEEAPAASANDTSTASSMSSGSQRRASMEVARRLTADPQLLESLISQLQKGSEADVSTTSTTEEEQRRLPSPAPLSYSTASNSALKKGGSSRKSCGPPSVPPPPSQAAAAAAAGGSTGNEVASSQQQQQRRTTASPTSFAWLLDALPVDDSLESSADPSDSSSTAQGRKSPRVNRRRSSVKKPATVPTPAAPAADSNRGGGAAAGPTTSTTTQAQGQTFSMSPPRLPIQGSTRKPLRSCLSSKKERPPASPSVPGSAAKKSVIFGSPGGAVFHKGSPTTSLTPMTKGEVMRYFPQEIFPPPGEGAAEEEEEEVETGVTAENTAILARWENDPEEEDEAEGGKRKELREVLPHQALLRLHQVVVVTTNENG